MSDAPNDLGLEYKSDWGDGVGRILLRRPDQLNAMRLAECEAMLDVLRLAAGDPEVRCLALLAESPGWCSGLDLSEVTGDPGRQEHVLRTFTDVLHAMLASRVPIVSGVNGWAVGGGHQLQLCSDLTIAGESATFKHSGLDMNLSPGETGTYMLALCVGLRRAQDLVFRPRSLTAAEAHDLGLCTEVVADRELEIAVKTTCEDLAKVDPVATELAKRILGQAVNDAVSGARMGVLAGNMHLSGQGLDNMRRHFARVRKT
jgi:enoyl-CoA hydratase/carnithine racemase